jgi:hypothetical protein
VPATSLEDVAIRWAEDGRSLYLQRRTAVYSYRRKLDQLFVVDGLQ